MQDRGYERPETRNRWFKIVRADGSGRDAYIHPNAIRALKVEDPEIPELTLWCNLYRVTGGQFREVPATITGSEARELIDALDRMLGLTVEGTWVE